MTSTPGSLTGAPASQVHEPPSLGEVKERIVNFLEHFWDTPLVDRDFLRAVVGSSGEERFASLVEKAGYGVAAERFLADLVGRLREVSGRDGSLVEIGGLVLPYNLLLSVLELLDPRTGVVTVKRVAQLEEVLNAQVPEAEREGLQRVIELYPVRLSMHVARQMRLSAAVRHQYLPFAGELDPTGEVHTWVGQFFRGIVEQMYRNRAILIMNMTCPVYCRFCFRKHKECRDQRSPTKLHVKQAAAYIREAPEIEEVVLTGGDPFMNKATLRHAVQELAKIPHVKTLRLASRAVSYYPQLFLRDESAWVRYLIRTNLELLERGKRLELATHFVHPDEISADSLDIVSRLSRNGVPVYVQTPFVAGCNESGREMVTLFNVLRGAGAELHYIFMPTSPIQGNRVYWAPVSRGLEAMAYLRANISDRAMPHVTTATRIGKIDWNSSGWAVERDEEDPSYLWIRTPYTHEYYESFAPIMQPGRWVRANDEGTLDAAFHVEVGDDSLIAGPRALASSTRAFGHKLAQTEESIAANLGNLQALCLEDQRGLDVSLGRQPSPALCRDHLTRAELDCGAADEDIELALGYLREHEAVTDVVLSRRDDVLTSCSRTLEIVDRVEAIPHVVAVRLRSRKLVSTPAAYNRPVLDRLAARSKLRIVRPKRLEIETTVLRESELGPGAARVVRELRLRGITVYANIPLLGLINDNEQDMLSLTSRCRQCGVEVCNVYVAGAPVQRDWNEAHPIELNSVVDIATYVRRLGSGRQQPRYVLRTALGEVDFSIAPRIFTQRPDGGVSVTLRPHDLAYFQRIDPRFEWPAGVEVAGEGHPCLPVSGIRLEQPGFLAPPREA